MQNTKLALATLALCLYAAVGCVEEKKGSRAAGYGSSGQLPLAAMPKEGPWDAGGARTSIRETIDDSPCAQELQDLGGWLLLYAKVNRAMPATLEDLRSVMGATDELKTSCPVSHKHYLYVPNGLRADSANTSDAYKHFPDSMKEKSDPSMVVVLADAELAHAGGRWCVFMSTPRPGKGRAIDVRLVPEPVFRTMLPVIPAPPMTEQVQPQQTAPMSG